MVNHGRELTDNNILLKDIPRMTNAKLIMSKIIPAAEGPPLNTDYQQEYNRQMITDYARVERYIQEGVFDSDNLVQCFIMNCPNREAAKATLCSRFGFSRITLIFSKCKGTGGFGWGPAWLIDYYIRRGGRDSFLWEGRFYWVKFTEWRPRPVQNTAQ